MVKAYGGLNRPIIKKAKKRIDAIEVRPNASTATRNDHGSNRMMDDELKNSTSSTQGSNTSNSSSRRKRRRRAVGGSGGGGNPLSDITNQGRPTSALESMSSRYVSYRSTEAKAVSGMASTSTASAAVVPTGGGTTASTPPWTRSSKKEKSISLVSTLTLTNTTTAAATCQLLSAVKGSTTNHPIHDDCQVEITPKVDNRRSRQRRREKEKVVKEKEVIVPPPAEASDDSSNMDTGCSSSDDQSSESNDTCPIQNETTDQTQNSQEKRDDNDKDNNENCSVKNKNKEKDILNNSWNEIVNQRGEPHITKGMMKRMLDVKEDDESVMKKLLASCGEKRTKNDENKVIHNQQRSCLDNWGSRDNNVRQMSSIVGRDVMIHPSECCNDDESEVTADTALMQIGMKSNKKTNIDSSTISADAKNAEAVSNNNRKEYTQQGKEHGSDDYLSVNTDHPELPPGWKVKLSRSKNRPYYVHPDHGATWYFPGQSNASGWKQKYSVTKQRYYFAHPDHGVTWFRPDSMSAGACTSMQSLEDKDTTKGLEHSNFLKRGSSDGSKEANQNTTSHKPNAPGTNPLHNSKAEELSTQPNKHDQEVISLVEEVATLRQSRGQTLDCQENAVSVNELHVDDEELFDNGVDDNIEDDDSHDNISNQEISKSAVEKNYIGKFDKKAEMSSRNTVIDTMPEGDNYQIEDIEKKKSIDAKGKKQFDPANGIELKKAIHGGNMESPPSSSVQNELTNQDRNEQVSSDEMENKNNISTMGEIAFDPAKDIESKKANFKDNIEPPSSTPNELIGQDINTQIPSDETEIDDNDDDPDKSREPERKSDPNVVMEIEKLCIESKVDEHPQTKLPQSRNSCNEVQSESHDTPTCKNFDDNLFETEVDNESTVYENEAAQDVFSTKSLHLEGTAQSTPISMNNVIEDEVNNLDKEESLTHGEKYDEDVNSNPSQDYLSVASWKLKRLSARVSNPANPLCSLQRLDDITRIVNRRRRRKKSW